MDSHSLNTSSRSNSFYQPSWRNYINGKLIRYSNKICKCIWELIWGFLNLMTTHTFCIINVRRRKGVDISGGGYMKKSISTIKLFFKGGVATFVDHVLLNILRFEVKELKDIVQNSIQSVKDSTTTKILIIQNVVFFYVQLYDVSNINPWDLMYYEFNQVLYCA